MADYHWTPIAPLAEAERQIDLAAIRPLYDSWRAVRSRLQSSSPASLRRFTERLVRRLSVETGILERIYDIDRGTTEALVAQGFAEDFVTHSSTNLEPGRLIDILRDHEAATALVMDYVSRGRELTVGFVHELHALLTQHQDTTTALDQFGNRLEIPLLKGQFKTQPNNPKRPDGSVHEYAPPIHVQSEVENLLRWLKEYEHDDPVIVAAWLQHRFTQIHPYQDGNGRVSRALTTLVLLRAELLPLVIDRDLRVEYITALENADSGDLGPLANLFARLERAAILEALSINVDAEIVQDRALTTAVIESIAAKVEKKKEAKRAEWKRVNVLAGSLRGRARKQIQKAFNDLKRPLRDIAEPDIHISDGGPDRQNSHWYKFEVVKLAKSKGKYANFDEDHYFITASIRVERERLKFVTSFHHVGRELSGIMEATAFARLESFEDSEEREYASQDFTPCSLEPFVLTYMTREEDIAESFERWLDMALAVAIKEFGDRL